MYILRFNISKKMSKSGVDAMEITMFVNEVCLPINFPNC